jgi:hypothetical protein
MTTKHSSMSAKSSLIPESRAISSLGRHLGVFYLILCSLCIPKNSDHPAR